MDLDENGNPIEVDDNLNLPPEEDNLDPGNEPSGDNDGDNDLLVSSCSGYLYYYEAV